MLCTNSIFAEVAPPRFLCGVRPPPMGQLQIPSRFPIFPRMQIPFGLVNPAAKPSTARPNLPGTRSCLALIPVPRRCSLNGTKRSHGRMTSGRCTMLSPCCGRGACRVRLDVRAALVSTVPPHLWWSMHLLESAYQLYIKVSGQVATKTPTHSASTTWTFLETLLNHTLQ